MVEREDGFLSRWARRKRDARPAEDRQEAAEPKRRGDPADAIPPSAAVESEEQGHEQESAQRPAEPVESIPDVDSLTLESDFRRFLETDVPQAVRNQALRKLWRLDPVFANLDGLNDYDEDYTQIGKSRVAGLRSLYRVGRGMISADDAATEAADVAGAAAEAPAEVATGGAVSLGPDISQETSAAAVSPDSERGDEPQTVDRAPPPMDSTSGAETVASGPQSRREAHPQDKAGGCAPQDRKLDPEPYNGGSAPPARAQPGLSPAARRRWTPFTDGG